MFISVQFCFPLSGLSTLYTHIRTPDQHLSAEESAL